MKFTFGVVSKHYNKNIFDNYIKFIQTRWNQSRNMSLIHVSRYKSRSCGLSQCLPHSTYCWIIPLKKCLNVSKSTINMKHLIFILAKITFLANIMIKEIIYYQSLDLIWHNWKNKKYFNKSTWITIVRRK